MTAEAQQLVYQAIGCVAGTLIKGEDDRYRLLTEHGELPVYGMCANVLRQLKKSSKPYSGQWTIYLRTTIKAELRTITLRSLNNHRLNIPSQFRVSGRVVYQRDGLIAIRIEPNVQIVEGKERTRLSQPFTITIAGELPEQAVGQFWQVDADLKADKLVMQNAVKLAEAHQQETIEAEHYALP